ncbi:MAG: PmoA family protein, partial [Saprospiraceae bacterium]|nr:PmoA family protein [Saprospiraceae bacterium]
EQWIVQTYAGPEQAHVVDLEIIHTPKVDTLVLPKYHYGGFGYRANDAWNFEGTDASPYDSVASVLTSLGDDHTTANHTRPEWVTMWGSISDRIAGIAILSHPTNFRHPQPVRVHPVMPYFTFAPMVLGEFKLLEGAPYRARYRIATFDGQPNPTFLDNLQQSFARL